jgi:hypothetical protein
MATVLVSFGLILCVVLIMSVGVLFGRKPLSGGSCGNGEDRKPECAECEKYGQNGQVRCPGQKG